MVARHLLSLALAVAWASTAAAQVSVKVKYGTVQGSTSNNVDTFNGIPFAQPPVNNLRLRPPVPITKSFGTVTAASTVLACPQQTSQSIFGSNPFGGSSIDGEDCLTLNIQRPSSATSTSKLPVLVFIFGGAFEQGGSGLYDAENIITKSVSLGKPILFAAMNYRLNGFGFLGGKEVKAAGASNLGLRDQRLALQWISDNIAAFGGDPDRITIWGESAGAISVLDHTIINGGNNTYNGRPLFRAGIMDSGSILSATAVDSAKPQTVYNQVVAAAGCSGAADTLNCLRQAPYATLHSAINNQPGVYSYQALDFPYLPRYDPSDTFFSASPYDSIVSGKYTKVPVIIGDQEDEGTLFAFSQNNLTSTDDIITYFASYFPTAPRAAITAIVNSYPDDPAAGSPFRTGDWNSFYPEFKRIAAILGDLSFTLTRRLYLSTVAKTVPAWSYLSSYGYGTAFLGTYHGTDLLYAFDDSRISSTAAQVQTYYIAFVNQLNPNALGTASPLIRWPRWRPATLQLLQLQSNSLNLLADNFRNASYAAIAKYGAILKL